MLGVVNTCNVLLQELQQIWIDIGESEAEKDRMLIELEIECLEVYRRKLDEAANAKARLHQSVAAKEAELTTLMASLADFTIQSKSERIHKVLAHVSEVHLLCGVLGSDFGKTVGAVHPSLHDTSMEQATNISDSTLKGLENAILKLKTERKVRFQKLKDIVTSLFDLWNIMETTREERRYLSKVTSIVRMPEEEIAGPGALSTEIIQQVSQEVERLNKLKASRMKELVLKRRAELEEICFKTHLRPDPSTAIEKSNAMIDSGLVDPGELLVNIEAEISKVSKEALSRKEIIYRIDRWLSAWEEENWLESYNLDQNRYSGGRSTHVSLKRAEQARMAIKKIPAIVDNLICKTVTWEDDNKKLFLYDGARLVTILEECKLSRLQKEVENKRSRDQKKMRDLLLTEKESMYGSKPTPRRASSFRKSTNGNLTATPRRNSIGNPTPDLVTPRSYSGRHNGYFKESRKSLNFVSIPKEDTISFSSLYSSEPGSPPQS